MYSLKSISNILKNTLKVMTKVPSYSDYTDFKKVLDSSKNIIVLTGAGISAESGIPTFRGPRGLWRTHRATDLASPIAFRSNPSLVWEFYHYRRTLAFEAQPNKAHLALAAYEKICDDENRRLTIITQNVDGLHIRAGSKNVIELHGSLRKVQCTKCKKIFINTAQPLCTALAGRGDPGARDEDLIMIPKEELPRCEDCRGLLRPYIVWFGENLDHEIMEKSKNLVENCDMCLVIGTSSIVYPAAMFAPLVAERKKPVAEFNLNDLPARDNFSFHFPGPCGSTLPKALGIENII